MFIAILIAGVAAYFAFSSISFLTMTPVSEWTAVHLAIIALTVILIGFAVYFAVRAWKLWKKKAAKINEQIKQQEAKQREKKRSVYMEDYDNPTPDEAEEKDTEETEELLAAADEDDDAE